MEWRRLSHFPLASSTRKWFRWKWVHVQLRYLVDDESLYFASIRSLYYIVRRTHLNHSLYVEGHPNEQTKKKSKFNAKGEYVLLSFSPDLYFFGSAVYYIVGFHSLILFLFCTHTRLLSLFISPHCLPSSFYRYFFLGYSLSVRFSPIPFKK